MRGRISDSSSRNGAATVHVPSNEAMRSATGLSTHKAVAGSLLQEDDEPAGWNTEPVMPEGPPSDATDGSDEGRRATRPLAPSCDAVLGGRDSLAEGAYPL